MSVCDHALDGLCGSEHEYEEVRGEKGVLQGGKEHAKEAQQLEEGAREEQGQAT